MRSVDTEVVVVGAGPVGLTLAIALGQAGVRCILVERKPAPQFLPKMERCNARTMEIFRRMGLAGRVRAAGLPAAVPMDVYIVQAMNRAPLLRLPYPSVDEARREIDACSDGSMPLEPYQLISQYTLEPLLKAEAEKLADVRYGCDFLSLTQDDHGVSAAHSRKSAANPFPVPRRLRRRRQHGAPAARHRARGRGRHPAAAAGAVPLRRAVRPHPDRSGTGARAALPRRRRAIDLPHHAGLDAALDAARGGRARRGDGGAVREGAWRAAEVRDAVRRRVEAEPAARRELPRAAACSSPATRCT